MNPLHCLVRVVESIQRQLEGNWAVALVGKSQVWVAPVVQAVSSVHTVSVCSTACVGLHNHLCYDPMFLMQLKHHILQICLKPILALSQAFI